MALTDQVIMPGSDYQAICDATRSLTGKTGTLKSGNVSSELRTVTPKTEMWILNGEGKVPKDMRFNVDFVSKDKTTKFISIALINNVIYYLKADNTSVDVAAIDDQISETEFHYSWQTSDARRQMIFSVPPHGELLTWLQQNAKKVTSSADTNLKDEISFSPSSVETILDYSDSAIDGLKKVTVAGVQAETKKVALSMTSGNQIIDSTSGKYMTQVTVEKPSTLIPSNIKKGVNIGGVVGTVEEQHTTVVFAATSSLSTQLQAMATKRIDKKFINNGVEYVSIQYNHTQTADVYYVKSDGTTQGVYSSSRKWFNDTFRKVTFLETLEEDFVTMLDSISAEYWIGDYAIQATKQIDVIKDDVGTNWTMQANSPYDVVDRIDVDVQQFSTGVDLPFTKLTTVSTDNGILSFSFTGYYDTIIAKRSGTNKILTAVFGNNLKASFGIESEGSVLSTSAGFSYNQVGNKFNITWNISNSSGSVWYEGSYDIYGCSNG